MATRTISDSGGTRNWNDTASWVEGAVPVAGDDVVSTATSGNISQNVVVPATGSLASLNLSNYTGTLTLGSSIDIFVGGNVTLGSSMSFAGVTSNYLVLTSTATLTSNGKAWGSRLEFRGAYTYTLLDNWSNTRLKTSTGAVVLNGYQITCTDGTNINTDVSGTTDLLITGGTLAMQAWCSCDMTLQGNITLGSGVNEPNFKSATLTYSSGTITMGGNDLNLMGGSAGTPTVLNTSGVTWYRLILSGGGVSTQYYSLSSTLNATTLAIPGGAGPIFLGAAGFNVGTLTNSSALDSNRSITLLQGNTYTVTTAITLAGNTTNHWTLTSSDANDVVFTFSGGTPPSLTLVRATHLDSSGGTAIYTDDTITSCLNWSAPPSGGTVSAVFNVTP